MSFAMWLCFFIRTLSQSLHYRDTTGQFFHIPCLAHVTQGTNKTWIPIHSVRLSMVQYGTVWYSSWWITFSAIFPISDLDPVGVEMSLMHTTTRSSRMIFASLSILFLFSSISSLPTIYAYNKLSQTLWCNPFYYAHGSCGSGIWRERSGMDCIYSVISVASAGKTWKLGLI